MIQPSTAPLEFIRQQFVSIFLKQIPRSSAGLLFCMAIIFGLLYSKNQSYILTIWLGCSFLAVTLRFLFLEKLLHSSSHGFIWLSVSHTLHGVALGLSLFAFGWLTNIEKSIVTIMFLTLSTASAATTNGYKNMYLFFTTPMLLPLCFAWAFSNKMPVHEQSAAYTLAFLIFIYYFFVLAFGRDLQKLFIESCQIRFKETENNERLKIALEEAKNASLAKTRFLASASHDLRQPIHSIGVLLAALGLRNLDLRSREIVDVLTTVNSSLSSQLSGLLDISKLDAGVISPEASNFNLVEMGHKHIANVIASFNAKDLHIRLHSSESVWVHTDYQLLERVLMNLTNNALKFTNHGGVDITIKSIGNKAVLEVIDTGIGIKDQYTDLIFQEFYQIGNSERDRSAGLGLGLSIIKRICSLLDIDIKLHSKFGEGSCFTLTMPIRNCEQITAELTKLESIYKKKQLSVLVIDDEIDILIGMRLLLEELGCTVAVADDISKAVEYAKVQRFDLVFSDFRLRNMQNGIDAITRVRSLQPHIHAVLISGDTAPERLQEAKAAAIPLLHKPVSLELITKHLQIAGAET